jgi:superfamily II DNA or RNA helicase
MLQQSSSRGIRSIFTVHRRELIHQTVDTLRTAGVFPGIIASGYEPDKAKLVQVASIQTLVRRLEKTPDPGLLVFDESHHLTAKSWSKVANHFSSAYRIGLTATPERLDGKGLGDHFETMVLGPTTGDLIQQGYLADYKAIVPPGINTKGIKKRGGDFRREDLAALVGQPSVTGCAIKEYIERTPGKRAIAFCVSIEHSTALAEAFRNEGVPAEHVDGNTSREQRDAAMARFRSGETLVLCNVDLFGEGVDVPAAEVGIFLRPTCSLALYLQQIGRVLRPNPGKEYAHLHDHAANILRHGLPDDPREWSLAGREKTQDEDNRTPIRVCPKCFAAVPIGGPRCKICQAPFPVKSREVATRSGRLEEVDKNAIRKARRQEQGRAETKADLIELAKRRGYRNPAGWAHFVWTARQRKR